MMRQDKKHVKMHDLDGSLLSKKSAVMGFNLLLQMLTMACHTIEKFYSFKYHKNIKWA